MQSPLQAYADAIGQVESGGNYSSLGPLTQKGDRAYGKYQVMGSNIPAWTQIATGQSMTPKDFLASPAAQDQVFNHYFGGALNQYGNPQDAASVWFSGRPQAKAGNASDGYNTTPQYVNKFNQALGAQSQDGNVATPKSNMLMAFADPDGQNAQAPAAAPASAAAPAAASGRPDWMTGVQGVGDALQGAAASLMSISNPEGAKAISGALSEKLKNRLGLQQMLRPSWGVIGTDQWGNQAYGWINPNTQTVTPGGAGGTGSPSQANGASQVDPVTAAIQSGAHGEDLLKQPGVPAGVASIVRGIAGGAQNFSPSTMLRTPQGKMALALLDQYEPGVTQADYAGRAAGMRDWATKSAELTRRASNAAQHGAELVDSFKDLDNSQSPAVNAVKNWFGTDVTGKGAPVAAKLNITAFANEMGALMRGNGGSDAATAEWEKGFPVNGSPDQQRAAIAKGAQLFEDGLNSLQAKRLMSVGPVQDAKLAPVVSPKMQAALDKMKAYGAGSPDPSQPQAPAAPAAPPVQGARQAPDGHFYVPDPARAGKYLRVDQ